MDTIPESRSRSRLPIGLKQSQSNYRERSPKGQALPTKSPVKHNRSHDERGRSREREVLNDNNLDDSEPQEDLISLMGFSGFTLTKGKTVKGTKGGSALRDQKPEYRQYMNREKGFNRPLSPTRSKSLKP